MKKQLDCDQIYKRVLDLSDELDDKDSLFQLAQCFIEGFPPEKLRAMLKSADAGIVSDGLFVLGEVGKLAEQFVDDVTPLLGHSDEDVKRDAEAIARVWLRSKS